MILYAILAQSFSSDWLEMLLAIAFIALSVFGTLAKKLIDYFSAKKKEEEFPYQLEEVKDEPAQREPRAPMARPMPVEEPRRRPATPQLRPVTGPPAPPPGAPQVEPAVPPWRRHESRPPAPRPPQRRPEPRRERARQRTEAEVREAAVKARAQAEALQQAREAAARQAVDAFSAGAEEALRAYDLAVETRTPQALAAIQVLRNPSPTSLRAAVLLSELLAPPLSLRNVPPGVG